MLCVPYYLPAMALLMLSVPQVSAQSPHVNAASRERAKNPATSVAAPSATSGVAPSARSATAPSARSGPAQPLLPADFAGLPREGDVVVLPSPTNVDAEHADLLKETGLVSGRPARATPGRVLGAGRLRPYAFGMLRGRLALLLFIGSPICALLPLEIMPRSTTGCT